MSRSDEKKMAALIRKNMAKAAKASKTRRKYDSTLPDEKEEHLDSHAFFSEMKKREF